MAGLRMAAGARVPGVDSEVAADTFTDVAGTLLENHTPEKGGPWTLHPSAAVSAKITDAGRVRSDSTGNGPYVLTSIPETADVEVSADLLLRSDTTATMELVARVHATETTYYAGGYDGGDNTWRLFRFLAGGFSMLASGTAAPLTLDIPVSIALRLVGSAITFLVDDVAVYAETNTDIAVAGQVGLRLSGLSDDTSGPHLDNFSAVNL